MNRECALRLTHAAQGWRNTEQAAIVGALFNGDVAEGGQPLVEAGPA